MCNLHRGILSKLFRDAVGEVDGVGLSCLIQKLLTDFSVIV